MPPKSARPGKRKRQADKETAEAVAGVKKKATTAAIDGQVVIQFVDPEGNTAGPELDVPLGSTKEQLGQLLNQLLENEEEAPYSMQLEDNEIASTLGDTFGKIANGSTERTLQVKYYPLAVFRVRPVTRCTSSMQGHTEAVLCAAFSPDSLQLATGSGDMTVRIWDLNTELPRHTCQGHSGWVLTVAWSPDGSKLASAGMDKAVGLWDSKTGKALAAFKGHTQPVTCVCWQPLHVAAGFPLLLSASKDATVRIWDTGPGTCLRTLSGHTSAVMQVRWSGERAEHGGEIITAGRDRLIKVWSPSDGSMITELKGHAHWINSLALNTDQALRTGPYTHEDQQFASLEDKKEAAKKRYAEHLKLVGEERLLSGSDDFTLYLWRPLKSQKPLCRVTGHQKVVNHVKFSPDGRYFASASFDKTVRLWDGRTGRYIHAFRGHVGEVYMVQWSADSRMVASASKDSTVKVWDVEKRKLKEDLPGHADEVFAVDWSGDGQRVCTGGKDRVVKIWRH